MQDAQLISQAGLVESLASDGLVSVSTGAGQPQKNMELAKFADSLGSSVPLQQTSEQVSITGLYARTNDGKMVELTKESVASIVSELIGTATLSKDGLLKASQFIQVQASDYSLYKICSSNGKTWVRNNFVIKGSYNSVPFQYIGGVYYKDNIASPSVSIKSSYGVQSHIKFYNKNGDVYVFFNIPSTDLNYAWVSSSDEMFLSGVGNQSVIDSSYTEISPKIDVFGYNTLAELSSGVAEQMSIRSYSGRVEPGSSYVLTGCKGGLYIFQNTSASYVIGMAIVDYNGVATALRSNENFKLEESADRMYMKIETGSDMVIYNNYSGGQNFFVKYIGF